MEVGLLVLRGVLGAFFIGHGSRKLLGWFGGYGVAGSSSAFEEMGLRPGRGLATAAGVSEVLGGVLLVAGFLTPLAATLVIGPMMLAIAIMHWRHGPWVSEGGWENNALLIAVAFAVAATGPGMYSLDRALDTGMSGLASALGALGASVLGAVLVAGSTRMRASSPADPRPAGM
jgi:putative oxidoreductase